MFQSYGQYWLDGEVCDCGPFVIEPVAEDKANANIALREHKLTFEPQVRKKERISLIQRS